MSRPSEPLLRWLRQQVDARGENTASLAARLSRSRAELRRILTGVEPLTVDDLVRLTEALGLTIQDMGIVDPRVVEAAAGQLDEVPESAHWGNQPRTLFQIGFDHGIDFMFLAAADELEGWGGPEAVREAHRGRDLAIQLDSQFHRFMNPKLTDEHVELRLSFDTLYDCRFPWTAVRRVVFAPMASTPPEPTAEHTNGTAPGGRPQLRLVK